jgi:hypothetical protein
VDRVIQGLQTKLHTQLVSAWNLSADSVYHCYGRCDRNLTEGGYIAEILTEGNDYREVFWDDALSAISFFVRGDKVEYQKGESKAPVSVIFFVNVKKLKPLIPHRADEEVRLDVLRVFQGPMLLSYETGLDNVLREFPGSKEKLRVADMQPVHCFRINLNLIYQNC